MEFPVFYSPRLYSLNVNPFRSKQHYGDLFQKAKYDKELLRKKREKQNEAKISNHQEGIIYMLFVLGGLIMLLAFHKNDYDSDVTTNKNTTQRSNDLKKV